MEPAKSRTLDPASASVVVQSAQFVADHGNMIASRLYQVLFERYPHTLKLFSMDFWPRMQMHAAVGNGENAGVAGPHDKEQIEQFKVAFEACTKGFSIQPTLMADSLQKYLVHMSDFGFDLIMNKIERICQKHVSRNIRPEHYPLIRDGLLAGIEHALDMDGGSVPHLERELVLKAWGEAYDLLAAMFMERERILRSDLESRPNGWSNFEPFRVVKVEETDKLWRFHLERANKQKPPQVMPGQFVCARLVTPDVGVVHRNFFLDPSPSRSVWIFSIQKAPPGDPDAVHDRSAMCKVFFAKSMPVGSEVALSMPLGGFLMKK